MEPISHEQLHGALYEWLGLKVYIHFEINPGGYFRNGKALLSNVHIRGEGPYRVFLEFEEDRGIIQLDNLTHMSINEDFVIITGYDDFKRLARTVEISLTPFQV